MLGFPRVFALAVHCVLRAYRVVARARHGAFALLLFASSLAPHPVHAQEFAGEYELKAALLRQLVNYVAWPANAPRNICVVGEDPFGAALDRAFVDIRSRVRRLSANSPELAGCGLVFVSSSEAAVLPDLLDRLQLTRALSVSDIGDFADDGGMVAMKTAARRVKLRIHLDRTRRAGLRVDAKLLRLCEVIGNERGAST